MSPFITRRSAINRVVNATDTTVATGDDDGIVKVLKFNIDCRCYIWDILPTFLGLTLGILFEGEFSWYFHDSKLLYGWQQLTLVLLFSTPGFLSAGLSKLREGWCDFLNCDQFFCRMADLGHSAKYLLCHFQCSRGLCSRHGVCAPDSSVAGSQVNECLLLFQREQTSWSAAV